MRSRSALAVAATAAAIGIVLGSVAYSGIRSSLVEERQTSARRQADLNARSLRNGLRGATADPGELLEQLRVGPEGDAVLRIGDQVYSTSAGLDDDALPSQLVEAVLAGDGAQQRSPVRGTLSLVTGLPIAESGAEYFEVTSLEPVAGALDFVAKPLVMAAWVATVLGGIVGIAISGAVMQPVTTTSALARRIAAGDGGARLDVGDDPALVPLADSFNDMVDQLHARIERERSFASDVSHELRGPLTVLDLAVQRVDRQREVLPDEAAAAVEALETQVQSFNRLVLDLLEISRFDAGTAELVTREVDLGALVHAVLDERGERVPVVEPDGTVRAEVDPRRIQQILTNLVDNAARYAAGATRIVVRTDAGRAIIEVEDEGPGIDDGERQRIFDRFERGTAGRAQGASSGTGLGLALSAHHAELHGGSITVQNRPDRGAVFRVELPGGAG